jgi:hypothetical protein
MMKSLCIFVTLSCFVYQVASNTFQGTINLGKSSSGISISNPDGYGYETGKIVTNLGDFNGDGYTDVGIFSECNFYVVFGSYSGFSQSLGSLTSTTGFSITGEVLKEGNSCTTEGTDFSNIAPLGDINNDGLADIIIVAVPVVTSFEPVYYIIYGAGTPTNIDLDNWDPALGVTITATGEVPVFDSNFGVNLEHQSSQRKIGKKTPKFFRDWDADARNSSARQQHMRENLNDVHKLEEDEEQIQTAYFYDDYFGEACVNATSEISRTEIAYESISMVMSQMLFPVGPIGDVNGDGFADTMIVGSILPHVDNFTFFVYYGGDSLPDSFAYDSFSYSDGYTFTADAQSFPTLIDSYESFKNTTVSCLYNETDGGQTTVRTQYFYNDTTIWHGIAFSSAGDMNNDGFDDIIIGSSYGNGFAGLTFILYGSDQVYDSPVVLSQLTTSQGYKIYGTGQWRGNGVGDRSGFSVGGTGMDFNKDGFDDVVIGAPRTNNNYGSAYVIYGTASNRKSIHLATMTSSTGISIFAFQSARLGISVSTAGDYNNDGYDDVIIGANIAAGGAGIAYIIYGGSNLVNIQTSALTASQGLAIVGIKNTDDSGIYSVTGTSVSGGGDFNHDGLPDVIVGAPGYNLGGYYSCGEGYVVFGTSTEPLTLFLKYLSSVIPYQTQKSPLAVSVPGDLNNDGYIDLLMGAFLLKESYIVFGAPDGFSAIANLTTGAGNTIEGNVQSWFGFSISGTNGDFNGDGITDFLIGAPGESNYYYDSPYPFYYSTLSGSVANSNAYILFGANNLAAYGYEIDVNTLNTTGRGINIIGKDYSLTGFSVAGLGNVNQNKEKLSSVIVGAPEAADGSGEVYVIFGNKTLETVNLDDDDDSTFITFTGIGYYDYLGFAVASAGDFNGDEIPDFLLSAPGADYDNSESGSYYSLVGIVYLLFGSSHLANWKINSNFLNEYNQTFGLRVIGSESYGGIGTSLSGIGDINGDGNADFIIGAPYAKNWNGAAYVVYGTSSSLSSADIFTNDLSSTKRGFTLSTTDSSAFAGYSVSSAGDINNDGFADFMVGCPGLNDYAGTAYIIYGGKTLTDMDLSELSTNQGVIIVNDILYSQVTYSMASYSDSKGNIVALFGNNPAMEANGLGTCYSIVPGSAPKNSTIAPTARPTFAPSLLPTALPTAIPSHYPSVLPSLQPTMAPTTPPFWVSNGPLILGVVIPTVLSFIPIYFSKQICFYALTHWSATNRRRGLFQITIYSGCKKIFLKDFVEAMESKERKRELDEKEALTNKKSGGAELELSVLDKLKDDSSHTFVDNPLRDAEEGSSAKRLLGSPSPMNSPHFIQTFGKQPTGVLPEGGQSPRPSVQFRQSNVDIDSDDEQENELEGGLRNNNNNNNNNKKKNDMIIKSVYSLQFHNAEINALYQGKLLLIQDQSPNKELLKTLQSIHLHNKEESSAISTVVASTNEEKPVLMENSNGILSNFMEEWPIIRYSVVFFLFPFLESLQGWFSYNHSYFQVFSLLRTVLSFVLEQKIVILSVYGLIEMMNYYFYFSRRSSRSLSIRGSLLKLLFFGVRLFAFDYLYEMRKEWMLSSSFSSDHWVDLGYCSGLGGIYVLQQIGNCFISGQLQDCFQMMLHGGYSFPLKVVSSGSECYYLLRYSSTQQRKGEEINISPSRLNSFLPTVVNTVVFLSSFAVNPEYRPRPMIILSSVVFADYSTKLLLSVVPETWKRSLFDEWYERAVNWFWEGMDQGMERIVEIDQGFGVPF